MEANIMPTWFMLLNLLMGSGTDLLDYMSTTDYWQARPLVVGNDSPTNEMLIEALQPAKPVQDLSALLIELGSPDAAARDTAAAKILSIGPGAIPQLKEAATAEAPEVAFRAKELAARIQSAGKGNSVRRLMSIRTLGERKSRDALASLKKLTESDEMFVADYARAAIAAIADRSFERPHANSSDDAWLMPENCRAVLHFDTPGGAPLDFESVMTRMEPFAAAGHMDPAKAADMRKTIVAELLSASEKLGNIRLDGITVGISDAIGPNAGFAVSLMHGKFDAGAIRDFANGIPDVAKQQRVVAGMTVFIPEKDSEFFFANNEVAALVVGPTGNAGAVDKIITAITTGKGPLKTVPEMAKLIGAAETKQPVWGVMQVTDAYRQSAIFSAFDTAQLSGKVADGKSHLRFTGTGTDADKVKDAVAQTNADIEQTRKMITDLLQNPPVPQIEAVGRAANEILGSLQYAEEGTSATMTMTLPGTGLGMIMQLALPMVGMQFAMHDARPVQPVAPPPAPLPVR